MKQSVFNCDLKDQGCDKTFTYEGHQKHLKEDCIRAQRLNLKCPFCVDHLSGKTEKAHEILQAHIDADCRDNRIQLARRDEKVIKEKKGGKRKRWVWGQEDPNTDLR